MRNRFLVQGGVAALLLLVGPEIGCAQDTTLLAQAQIGSMRQESIKAAAIPDSPRMISPAADALSSGGVAQKKDEDRINRLILVNLL